MMSTGVGPQEFLRRLDEDDQSRRRAHMARSSMLALLACAASGAGVVEPLTPRVRRSTREKYPGQRTAYLQGAHRPSNSQPPSSPSDTPSHP